MVSSLVSTTLRSQRRAFTPHVSELCVWRKCVAALHRSLLHAGVEPALPLLGRAMREAVRHHPALRAPLQRIVTDCGGGAQRGLDVTGLQQMPALIGLVRPHAGEAIGLQLDTDLDSVCFWRAPTGGLLSVVRLRQDALEILHVMTDLMRDHIGLREPARFAIAAAEARLDLPEERRVEIDLLVGRAIEWTHRALR